MLTGEPGGYRLPVRVPPLLWNSGQIAVLLIVLGVFVALTLSQSPRARTRARWLTAASVLFVLAVTLLGPGDGSGKPNLVPGRGIYGELHNVNHGLGVFNVVGNIVMFAPLGWLLALLVRRRLLVPTLLGVGLSATIETVQAFIGRAPDIDDVILNGTGAFLGALVAVQLLRLRRHPRDDDAPHALSEDLVS